jgi:uncharacterized protein YggE
MQVRTMVLWGALAGAVVGAAAVGAPVWATGSPGSAGPECGASSPSLTVTGTGSATGTPDRVVLSVDVGVLGDSARSALDADDRRSAAVVAAVTGAGIPARDVQTTDLTVQPNYTTTPSGTPTLQGYTVDNQVVATIDGVAKAGPVVDAVTAAGGNDARIGSLSFAIADPRPLEAQAHRDAVRQAAARAAATAAAAGERLAGICAVRDQTTSTAPHVPAFGNAASAATVPLEPGTQQATAQVTLVYALDRATGR